jgi:hypothetical protein
MKIKEHLFNHNGLSSSRTASGVADFILQNRLNLDENGCGGTFGCETSWIHNFLNNCVKRVV